MNPAQPAHGAEPTPGGGPAPKDRPPPEAGPACRVPERATFPAPAVLDPAAWAVRRRRALRRSAAARAAEAEPGRAVTTVLLDMGGVVIPTLFETVAAPGFPTGPLGGERDYRAVERGELPERDYWARLVERRPDLDVGELWRACSYVRREVGAAVSSLAGRVRLVAFTNDMAHWFGDDWPERFPELAAFDAVLEAAKLGVLKPDPEAFRRAAAAVGEAPARCLFVDDLAANLGGAAAVGMQTLLFDVRDPAASSSALLARLGLGAPPPAGAAAPTPPRRRVFAVPRRGAPS